MPTDTQTPNPQLPYRYAVYFAPKADSEWWKAGSHWLGRCAASKRELSQPVVAGLSATELTRITAEPRRYGWHATLKAPFSLKAGMHAQHLLDTLDGVCRSTPRFSLPGLTTSTHGGFLALRPEASSEHLHALAARCVTELQPLVEPLSESELARRRQASLTPEQDQLLQRWGYPWVLDHFQFHLSLTGSLRGWPAAQQEAVTQAAQQHFYDLPSCPVDCISVFAEPAKGDDFVLVEQLELRG